MRKSIEAVYNGTAFVPEEAVGLAANTRVRLIVETLDEVRDGANSFLDVGEQLKLQGPADRSVKYDAAAPSPLDVPPVDLNLTVEEIVEYISEGRRYSRDRQEGE